MVLIDDKEKEYMNILDLQENDPNFLLTDIEVVRTLIFEVLGSISLPLQEIEIIAKNILDAELSNKKTHGIISLLHILDTWKNKSFKVLKEPIIAKENVSSLLFNGNERTGYYVMERSLNYALQKVKENGILFSGLYNTQPSLGYLGNYAKRITKENLIFMCFANCEGGLVPHGSIEPIWGTNPMCVGIPSNKHPVILDIASSAKAWGNLFISYLREEKIPEGIAIDKDGNPTVDSSIAMGGGGLLPFGGAKGSGIAFMIELLAGALTGSRVGYSKEGGWGTSYFLIDPSIFRPILDFKNDVSNAIEELKKSKSMPGVATIFYPGEKSALYKTACLEKGKVPIDKQIVELIKRKSN